MGKLKTDAFCTFCGVKRKKGDFCPGCGHRYGDYTYGGTSAIGGGGIGWSDQVNNPCFNKNNGKTMAGMLVAMVIVSAIIFAVIFFTSDMEFSEMLPIFGGVMVIEWVFWIIWLIGQFGSQRGWEGVVEEKKSYRQEHTDKDEDGHRFTRSNMVYKVHFRKNGGGKKTLTTIDRSAWYDYLSEGDRVRYHGKNMNYYEKYDKSGDPFIPCASCGGTVDARAIYCGQCGAVMLKGKPVQ